MLIIFDLAFYDLIRQVWTQIPEIMASIILIIYENFCILKMSSLWCSYHESNIFAVFMIFLSVPSMM